MNSKYITVDDTNATSLAEAKILAKQHEGLHWKVHRKCPGHAYQGTAVFQCNSHVNCPRLLRVACIQGIYYLQVKGGDHSSEVNVYARSNSSCTFEEQKLLKFGLDSGGKPGGIHSAMTKEVSSMLKLQGKDPLKHKRDEGGLKGARVYVSGVYQVRISHGFGRVADTRISCVSAMYQGCIRYVSVVALGARLIRVSAVV